MMKITELKYQNTQKTIVGIDYSLTSPCVCINNGNLMWFFLTKKKKHIGQLSEDIIGYEHKEWTDPIERFTNISEFVIDILSQCTLYHLLKVLTIQNYFSLKMNLVKYYPVILLEFLGVIGKIMLSNLKKIKRTFTFLKILLKNP